MAESTSTAFLQSCDFATVLAPSIVVIEFETSHEGDHLFLEPAPSESDASPIDP